VKYKTTGEYGKATNTMRIKVILVDQGKTNITKTIRTHTIRTHCTKRTTTQYKLDLEYKGSSRSIKTNQYAYNSIQYPSMGTVLLKWTRLMLACWRHIWDQIVHGSVRVHLSKTGFVDQNHLGHAVLTRQADVRVEIMAMAVMVR